MPQTPGQLSRRAWLKLLSTGAGGLALSQALGFDVSAFQGTQRLPSFTGPGPNPYWNSVGPVVTYPQKHPLILLTDRPVQLETPRHYFLTPFTPNGAFYVRWHLDRTPTEVDLSKWRLRVEGNVEQPLAFSLADLMQRFEPISVAAVNQCSGNSRSRFQPRVPGGQWGHGAMGNARWTGVRLTELLRAAGLRPSSVEVQFEGLDRGSGPEGLGSHKFLKSLELTDPVLADCLVAYAMNDAPLPMLNGFPVRLVVPGYFATYWMKALSWIRVLTEPDENFWMKRGYRIPATPRGHTSPEDIQAGRVKMVPINRMPVRSFIITPDGSSKVPARLPVMVRGVAFSGEGRVTHVEVSDDDGRTWGAAHLGEDFGSYSFRTWEFLWTPARPGRYALAARATDGTGDRQPDDGVWNPGGYLWNKIERQEIVVGTAT